jgi:hypothetical protein
MNELTTTALDLAHREHFTVPEWLEREKHITKIREFDRVRLSAAESLTIIRDKNLYRPYASLKEFCMRMFGWSERRAQQMIASVKVVSALPKEKRTIVRTESQARELAKYPEEQRAEILDEAARFHATDGKPTAKAIREVADQIGKAIDLAGIAIPEGDASYYWRRRREGEEVLAKIQAAGLAMKDLSQDDAMWVECELQKVTDFLKSAYLYFKGGLPAHVCTKCKGLNPKYCTFCHGRGMIGAWKWKKKEGGKEFLDELALRGK